MERDGRQRRPVEQRQRQHWATAMRSEDISNTKTFEHVISVVKINVAVTNANIALEATVIPLSYPPAVSATPSYIAIMASSTNIKVVCRCAATSLLGFLTSSWPL